MPLMGRVGAVPPSSDGAGRRSSPRTSPSVEPGAGECARFSRSVSGVHDVVVRDHSQDRTPTGNALA